MTFPALTAGAGFGGATATPGGIGSGFGVNETPIALWTDVPGDTYPNSGSLDVGVFARHVRGDMLVELSLQGGTWVEATFGLSAQTGVRGLYCTIDRSALTPGTLYEVRARVQSQTAGLARVLQGAFDTAAMGPTSHIHSFWFYIETAASIAIATVWASPTGSDSTGDGSSGNPYQTIFQCCAYLNGTFFLSGPNWSLGYGRIKLKAGAYAFPSMPANPDTGGEWYQDPCRFVSIEGDIASERDEVTLTSLIGAKGLWTSYVRLKHLKVTSGISQIGSGNGEGGYFLFLDDIEDDGGSAGAGLFASAADWAALMVRDSYLHHRQVPVSGYGFIVNNVIDNYGNDAMHDPHGLVYGNFVSTGVDLGDPPGFHMDLCQIEGDRRNFAIVGCYFEDLAVGSQALFLQTYGASITFRDFWMEDTLWDTTGPGQCQNPGQHWGWRNVSFLNAQFVFGNATSGPSRDQSISTFLVEGTFFDKVSLATTSGTIDVTEWAHNHYRDGTGDTPGTDDTTGGTYADGDLFVAPSADNYTAASGGDLVARLTVDAESAFDVNGNDRDSTTAVGAVRGADETTGGTSSIPGPHTFFAGPANGGTSPAINTTGMNLIVIAVAYFHRDAGAFSVSDSKGNTYVLLSDQFESTLGGCRVYFAQSPTVGAGHTFTVASNSSFPGVIVTTFGGMDPLPFDQQAFDDAAQPGAMTPTRNNALIVSAIGLTDDTTADWAVDGGLTIIDAFSWVNHVNEGVAVAYRIQTVAEETDLLWTYSGVSSTSFRVFSSVMSFLTLVAPDVSWGSPISVLVNSMPTLLMTNTGGTVVSVSQVAGATNVLADANLQLNGTTGTITAINGSGATPAGSYAFKLKATNSIGDSPTYDLVLHVVTTIDDNDQHAMRHAAMWRLPVTLSAMQRGVFG